MPPSPSPRNILSSPIPAEQQYQNQTQAQPQPFKTQPSKTPENFNAQFKVDFSNLEDNNVPAAVSVPATTSTQVPIPAPIQAPIVPPTAPIIERKTQNKDDNENLDNLFKSDYPDPFREPEHDDCVEITEIQANIHKKDVLTDDSVNQNLFNSKIGHRRNVSDTSTFKK